MKFRALRQYFARRKDTKRGRRSKTKADALRKQRQLGFLESLESRRLLATINYTVDDPANYALDNRTGGNQRS